MPMILPPQIRAARALLNWSRDDLAAASGIAKSTILNIEKGSVQARGTTSDQISRAFLLNGVIFTKNGGAEFQSTGVQIYEGREGFAQWFDDVYNTVKDGGDIAISGCREADFGKWFSPEQDAAHAERMDAISEKIQCRVILQEGDFDFAYSGYATYKWIEKNHWDANPLYVYGLKLAVIAFKEEGPVVTVINSAHAAKAFRTFFMAAWDGICRDVPPRRKVTNT